MEYLYIIFIYIVIIYIVASIALLMSKTPYNSYLHPIDIKSEDCILEKILSDYNMRLFLHDKEENLKKSIKFIRSKIVFAKVLLIFYPLSKKYKVVLDSYLKEYEEIKSRIETFKFTIPSNRLVTKIMDSSLRTISDDTITSILGKNIKGIIYSEFYLIIYNKYFLLIRRSSYEIHKAVNISSTVLSVSYDRKIEYHLSKRALNVGHTWEHARKDGNPDRRYSTNRMMYINHYYYFYFNQSNLRMYGTKNEIDLISRLFEIMKNSVIDSEKNGIFLLESIQYSKKFDDYCALYKNRYFKLVDINENEAIIDYYGTKLNVSISECKIKSIKLYNNYVEKLNSLKLNVGKYVLHNGKLLTIVDLQKDLYVLKDVNDNTYNLQTNVKILTDSEYHKEKLIFDYKDVLNNIEINVGDVYETSQYGKVKIIEILDKKINIRYSYNKNIIVGYDDFKLDIFEKKCVRVQEPTFKVNDYIFYNELGLFQIEKLENDVAHIRDLKHKTTKIVHINNLFAFEIVKLSYKYSDLKINNIIVDTRGNYGLINNITPYFIKMWTLDTHELKEINFWDCSLVDYHDSKFKDFIEINKHKIPKMILSQIVLNKDIYDYQEFKTIINKWFNDTNVISELQFNLITFGKKKIYLNSKYKDYFEYLVSYSQKNDFYDYEYSYESKEYDGYLSKCEKKWYFVKLNEYRYITANKLKELGIDKIQINNFIRNLNNYLVKNYFISVDLIKKEFDFKLIDLFQSDSNLLYFIKKCGFQSYKFAGSDIITINSNGYKQEIFEKTIIEILKYQKISEIDEYDLFNMLNEKMGFKFDVDSFELEANKFINLYFSQELEKVYLHKEDYYKELYNE